MNLPQPLCWEYNYIELNVRVEGNYAITNVNSYLPTLVHVLNMHSYIHNATPEVPYPSERTNKSSGNLA